MGNNYFSTYYLCVFFLASFFAINAIEGQGCTLRGVAVLADVPNGQVTVQLLDDTATKLLNFTVTDSLGQYAINNLPQGRFSLRLAQFGYSDTSFTFNCSGDALAFGPDTLFPLSLELGEISVVEKAVVLQRRGDTTQVNFRVLERGYEQSLTDILESVPGLELRNNQFTFEGKKINAVLVDGLNLSDQNQQRFTDGIFYRAVDGIQIIENYDPTGMRSLDSTTAQSAINIELSEEYRNKGQLSLRAEAGFLRAYHLRANYLRTQKKAGWRFLGEGLQNDAAEQSDTYVSDYIDRELQDQLFATTYVPLRPFAVAQLTQIREPLVESTNRYGLGIFHEARLNRNDRRIKGRLSAEHTNAASSLSGFRTYTDQSPTVSTARQDSPSTTNIKGKLDFQDKLGPTGQFRFSAPLSFNHHTLDGSSIISLADSEFANQQSESFSQYLIAPTYQLNWFYPTNWQLRVFGRSEHAFTDRSISVVSSDPIAIPTTVETSGSRSVALQDQEYQRQFYENQAQLSYKKNGLYAVANVSSLIYRDRLQSATAADQAHPFSGRDSWTLDAHTLAFSTRYDVKKFRLLGQIGAVVYRSVVGETLRNQRTLPTPRLLVLYRLSRKLHLSGGYSEKIRLPSIEQTTQLSLLQSQIARLTGGLPGIRPTLTKSLQLSLFKPVQVVEYPLLFNCSLIYHPAYTQPQLNSFIEGGFQRNRFENVDIQHEFSTNFFLSKSQRDQSFTLRFIASQKIFNQGGADFQDRFAVGNINWRRSRVGRWGLQLGGQFSWFDRTVGGAPITTNVNLNPELNVTYTHERTICELSQRYLFNDFQRGVNRYHQLDFRVTRKKLFRQFEASLALVDLLNFSGSEQAFSGFGQNYFETFSYRVLPGRILLGVKWYVD